jgi:hypothetical protein
MRFDAIIFDFDGVLLDSEFEGNQLLAGLLTSVGHPTTPQEAVEHYVGLSGRQFIDAVEARIGQPLPACFATESRPSPAPSSSSVPCRPSCTKPSLPRARANGCELTFSISAWIRCSNRTSTAGKSM